MMNTPLLNNPHCFMQLMQLRCSEKRGTPQYLSPEVANQKRYDERLGEGRKRMRDGSWGSFFLNLFWGGR